MALVQLTQTHFLSLSLSLSLSPSLSLCVSSFLLCPLQVRDLRHQLELRVAGFDVPKPLTTFKQCGFDATLMAAINKAGWVGLGCWPGFRD